MTLILTVIIFVVVINCCLMIYFFILGGIRAKQVVELLTIGKNNFIAHASHETCTPMDAVTDLKPIETNKLDELSQRRILVAKQYSIPTEEDNFTLLEAIPDNTGLLEKVEHNEVLDVIRNNLASYQDNLALLKDNMGLLQGNFALIQSNLASARGKITAFRDKLSELTSSIGEKIEKTLDPRSDISEEGKQ